MKKIYIAILSTLTFSLNQSQTIFDQGDIVIIGVNANNGGCSGVTAEDKVSLVSFIPITSGTVLHMTDNGYERCNVGQWGNSEGFYTCTYSGATIPAGTVFTFTFPNSSAASSPGWSFTTTGTLNLNSGGDQLYIMQGGVWNNGTAGSHNATYTGGRILCAFNTKNTWAASCGTSPTQNSNLHPQIPCGSYSIGAGSSDFLRYNGPMTITNRYNWWIRLTTSGNWINDANCTNYNTNFTITSIPIDYSFTTANWNGTIDNNWFNCLNWSTNRVPNEFTNVFISSTANNPRIDHTYAYSDNYQDTARCNDITLSGDKLEIDAHTNNILVCHGNLIINSTANSELDMSDGNTLTADGRIYLKGNWINFKTESDFKQGQSNIIFWSNGNQTISTSDPGNLEVFYNLTINKSAGQVTLNDNIEVGGSSGDPINDRNGVLTLTNRNIITGTNYLYVTNAATSGISGGSTSSFVDGNLRRHTNTVNLYDYPVGDGTRYMRAGVRTTNTSQNVIEVDAQNTGYGTYTPLESTPSPLIDVSTVRWWDISKISGTTPVSVRLYWMALADDGIVDANDLVVAHWSDRDHSGLVSTQQWWNRGRNAGNSTGTIADGYVESSETVSTYSPFTFGTITIDNPLPVVLTEFKGSCNDNGRLLSWATASEINNSYFTLERSLDGVNYTSIAFIPGSGNSNTEQNYSYLDQDKSNVKYYYRLSQTDYDGTTESFAPVALSCESVLGSEAFISLYNVSESNVMFDFYLQHESEYVIHIIDNLGRVIYAANKELTEGHQLLSLSTADWAAGIYTLQVTGSNFQEALKFFIK